MPPRFGGKFHVKSSHFLLLRRFGGNSRSKSSRFLRPGLSGRPEMCCTRQKTSAATHFIYFGASHNVSEFMKTVKCNTPEILDQIRNVLRSSKTFRRNTLGSLRSSRNVLCSPKTFRRNTLGALRSVRKCVAFFKNLSPQHTLYTSGPP